MEKLLDYIGIKNRDRLLAFLKRKGRPVSYSEVQKNLGFSIDYTSHLIRELKDSNLVYINEVENKKRTKKLIGLTGLGEYVAEEYLKLWLTPKQLSWLSIIENQDENLLTILNNSNKFLQGIIQSKEEMLFHLVSNSLLGHITDKTLIKALTGDILSSIMRATVLDSEFQLREELINT